MSEPTTTNDDDESSGRRNVYRGVLAVLREVSHCNQHSRDEEQLRNTKLLLRSTNTRKRSRRKNKSEKKNDEKTTTTSPQQQQSTTATTTTISLPDTITNNEFTILFFFDPRQQHSLLLRSTISDFCHRNNDEICCLAVFGGDPQTVTKEDIDDFDLFYRGTGFLEISILSSNSSGQQKHDDDDDDDEEEAGQQSQQQQRRRRTCIINLLKFLDVTQIPSVSIIPNSTGRPIMGQEMALEWNVGGGVGSTSSVDGENSSSSSSSSDDKDAELLQRWREGKSGLTLSQNVISKVLGDSNSACTIM